MKKSKGFNKAKPIDLNSLNALTEGTDSVQLIESNTKSKLDSKKKLKKVGQYDRGHKYHKSNFTR